MKDASFCDAGAAAVAGALAGAPKLTDLYLHGNPAIGAAAKEEVRRAWKAAGKPEIFLVL